MTFPTLLNVEAMPHDPNVTNRDLLYSIALGLAGGIEKMPWNPNVTDRDLLYSILQNIGGGGGGGSTFTSGAGAPAGGADGDTYLRTSNRAFYENQSGVWTILGYLAKTVSDTEVTFTTPTAGDLAATLG